MSASIVSRCDAPPVLDATEHVFDTISLAIELFVIVRRLLPLRTGRYACRYSLFFQRVAEPVSIVSSIGEEFPCIGQPIQQVARTPVIAGLASGEEEQ